MSDPSVTDLSHVKGLYQAQCPYTKSMLNYCTHLSVGAQSRAEDGTAGRKATELMNRQEAVQFIDSCKA